jgi:hypothetical protein
LKLWFRSRILEAVLKAYALGLFSAALALALVAAIWIGTQPRQEPGLVWGGAVYTSKEDFNVYLKSKGLSYKTWVARNPDAAPWEADTVSIGAITVRVSARGDSVMRLFLVAIGLLLAIGSALLLLGRQNPVLVRFAGGSVVFFSVFSAVVLLAIWFGGQPKEEPALLWGGSVYTSKQEFNVYLKSKGLSYKTWVARNPGAAPWEPPVLRSTAKAPEPTKVRVVTKAPAAAEAGGGGWLGRPLLAGLGLLVATACAFLLVRRERPAMARFASGSVALFSPGAVRIGRGPPGMPGVSASVERLGVVASDATGRLKESAPVYRARLLGSARALARLLTAAAHELTWRLAHLMHKWNITLGKVALALLTAGSFILVGVAVVLLLSSL